MAWDKLCLPKKCGGLGFRDLIVWNKAACFKHIWAIDQKKDSLWLKWIHHVYLQGGNIWEHEAPAHSSWNWRKLVSVMRDFKEVYQQKQKPKYTISYGYRLFSGEQMKIQWDRVVWNKWNHPKHSFIL